MNDLSFVINDNKTTILKSIIDCFKIEKLKKVQMGISFVRMSGVICLKPIFEKFIRQKGKIELLFGEDMNISESEALRELLKMGVILKVYRDQHYTYHQKIWIFHYGTKKISITGSSNISKGALEKSIEANIMISGKSPIINQQMEYFGKLWNSEKSLLIDDEYIDNYKDIEKTKRIKIKYKEDGSYNFSENSKTIITFVDDWIKYIKSEKKIGNLEKWRGWYLLPEHGVINKEKIKELRKVLEVIQNSEEYNREGFASFSTSRKDIKYVNSIINKAGITYKQRADEYVKRDWFIRQQKNYLERLGFLRECKSDKYELTNLGGELVDTNIADEIGLRSVYTKGLSNIVWAWGNIKFFKFLVQLMSSLPKNRVYFHELSLITSHTYHEEQMDSIQKLVLMWRFIPKNEKVRLIKKLEDKLEKELVSYRNLSAFGHYQGKVESLLCNFGYAIGLKYYYNESDMEKYIEIEDINDTKKYFDE